MKWGIRFQSIRDGVCSIIFFYIVTIPNHNLCHYPGIPLWNPSIANANLGCKAFSVYKRRDEIHHEKEVAQLKKRAVNQGLMFCSSNYVNHLLWKLYFWENIWTTILMNTHKYWICLCSKRSYWLDRGHRPASTPRPNLSPDSRSASIRSGSRPSGPPSTARHSCPSQSRWAIWIARVLLCSGANSGLQRLSTVFTPSSTSPAYGWRKDRHHTWTDIPAKQTGPKPVATHEVRRSSTSG